MGKELFTEELKLAVVRYVLEGENLRLRMENDYLKKLSALIQKREESK